ncbi:hypothetical protein GPECTOR_6g841 [Gonium pectorale]|uniref:Uncharacterized protein n=1 Tax=Gonium pectorale TaxID=33097 RepID=A0A150GVY5_GONPE|nr:hypothetical protein GPECTOR_6g841 [Gonium pectorale]|eukprot:KXZ53923.1 hypothetical protein GPECTOR_6g841 [Gonium pectorale]
MKKLRDGVEWPSDGDLQQRGDGSRQTQQAAMSPSLPSFAAFQAERQFAVDWCGSVLLWVCAAAAMAVRATARPTATSPPGWDCRGQREAGVALISFPCDEGAPRQVVHVLRHLSWYLLVRPVRVGDWAWAAMLPTSAALWLLLTALAVSPRGGRLWRWWCRYREAVLVLCFRVLRTALYLVTYACVPPHSWHATYVAPGSLSLWQRPALTTIAFALFDETFKASRRARVRG